MISVFCPSHNKGGMAVEAVRSVFAQSYQDWELWIMENSTDEDRTRNLLRKFTDLDDPRVHYHELNLDWVRRDFWAAPWLLNEYYPRASGDIIMYVSDDDLFMPGIFQAVAGHFEANPDHEAVYFGLARTVARNPGEGTDWSQRFSAATASVPRGTGQLDCIIDGGQVAYRKSVLDDLGQPYFYAGRDAEMACHCDGLHLEAVAALGVTFYPLPVRGVIHRHTSLSAWSKS